MEQIEVTEKVKMSSLADRYFSNVFYCTHTLGGEDFSSLGTKVSVLFEMLLIPRWKQLDLGGGNLPENILVLIEAHLSIYLHT